MAKSQILNTEDPQGQQITMSLSELRELLAGTRNAPMTEEEREADLARKVEEWKLEAKIKNEADHGARPFEMSGDGPQKSVYNPHGDAKGVHYPDGKPRADLMLPYDFYVFQYKVMPERQFTYTELELLRDIRPGRYTIEKVDGTLHEFDVIAETDHAGAFTKMQLTSRSSLKGDGKKGLPKFELILREMIRQHAEKATLVLA